MKKTDRDKDWPIVNGLGQRLTERGNPLGLLHLTDIPALRLAWQAAEPGAREALAVRRPLLRHLARTPAADDAELELLLLLERRIWERVNEARHSRYTRAWRDFYRRWSKAADFAWPTPEEFWRQQRKLRHAIREHGLPADPLGAVPRECLVAEAVARLTAMRFDAEEVKSLLPPVADLLP